MGDDIFCKIISGEIKKDFLYRDDEVIVIRDINPHAPVHLLVIPAIHVESIGDFTDENAHILGKMLQVAHSVAQEQNLKKGYRLIMNQGKDSGRLVEHMHLHVLGGKPLGPKLVES